MEPSFLIEGRHYPIPSVFTFTLDELDLLYQNCGLTLEDFSIDDDEDAEVQEKALADKQKHPGFRRTMVHVAYQRGNPTVKPAVVSRLVGNVSIVDAMQHMLEAEPAEDPTLPSTTPPDAPSGNVNGSRSGNGGDGSPSISTGPDTRHVTIGTGGSTMSSLGSPGPTPAS